jgi:hypothetical protein
MNYKCFEEEYEKFLANLDLNDLRKEKSIPETDYLKKNGTYERGLYYLLKKNLKYTRIRIQKLQWVTMVDGEEKKIYLSVFPSFVIKYNKLSADLIENISKKTRKGEDIFTVIADPDCLLPSEDLLHRACQKVDNTCRNNNYISILVYLYTVATIAGLINIPALIVEIELLRYPAIYQLYINGQLFIGKDERVLATLNRILKFLR